MSPVLVVGLQWLAGFGGALWLLWRHPGLVLFGVGVATSLVLWTWQPWAFWAGLAVTIVAALSARAARRRGRWDLSGGLQDVLGYPRVFLVVAASASVVLGPPWLQLLGFVVLVGAGVWWAWTSPATVTRRSARPDEWDLPPSPALGQLEQTSARLVVSGQCPHCPGVLVAHVRLPVDAAARDVAGLVVRAVCPDCGARMVGVVDPAEPTGLVWMDLPGWKAAG